MKKMIFTAAARAITLVSAVLMVGCATLDSIKAKLPGARTEDAAESTAKDESGTSTTAKKPRWLEDALKQGAQGGQGQQSKPQGTKVAVSSYKAPASYEEAYSYRTDTAYKNIIALLKDKNVDALRASNPSGYVSKICEAITASAKNDFEKAKMAHDAVCVLVSYDAKNFWAGTVPAQDFTAVLRTKTAVCEGYANLYKKYCDTLGLQCDKVIGYARGVGISLANEPSPTASNHAWNAIKLGGAWYLVDCTWDSGHMEGRVSKQEYNTDWLFLKPEHFIYTHFPTNSRYQLLDNPLTAAAFSAQPDLRPKFFELTESQSPLTKLITADGALYRYAFVPKAGYEFSCSLNDVQTGQEQPNCTFVQKHADKTEALFSLPKAGMYSVTLFWRKAGARQGQSCGTFLLESTQASSVRYPTTFASSAQGVEIISPIEMPLEKGKTYHFELRVTNKPVVAVVIGKTFTQLTNDGNGLFTGDVQIPATAREVTVNVANSEKSGYEGLAKYSVK